MPADERRGDLADGEELVHELPHVEVAAELAGTVGEQLVELDDARQIRDLLARRTNRSYPSS